ncbi:MAG: hypothetical protein RL681_661, partial [Candidatus Parcubacteria bacterium]
MTKKALSRGLIVAVMLAGPLFALADTKLALDAKQAFRQVAEIPSLPLNIPAVVNVPFPQDLGARAQYAVFNVSDNYFEPSLLVYQTIVQNVPLNVFADNATEYASASPMRMVDNDMATFTEFEFVDEGPNVTEIRLEAEKPITSSMLSLVLDGYVALPTFISIHAIGPAVQTVVARTRMTSETVTFPEATASTWAITLEYIQPLRIAELRLAQKNAAVTAAPSVRFLAHPGKSYRIYFDADRLASGTGTGEMPNLGDDRDVFKVSQNLVIFQQNQLYKPADVDGDGVQDILDNCVNVANSSQDDVNRNGRGDACDDFDRDGVLNSADNCVNQPNR